MKPSSPYNLARSENTQLWTSHFYDLSSWENGFCHTYNPTEKSETDFLSRIYFMMANTSAAYQDYDIFIHEKGQFWPRSDMFAFGQPDRLTLFNNSEMQIIFSSKVTEKLSTEAKPCVLDSKYSFSQCLREYVVKKTDCRIDFLVNFDQNKSCVGDSFHYFFEELIKMKQEKISKVQKDSGCFPKCKTLHFSYQKNEKAITWRPNWTSVVYVQPKSAVVEYSKEYYSFDINDLMSSVGGSLGLFLGWSLLTFAEALGFLLVIIRINRYFN